MNRKFGILVVNRFEMMRNAIDAGVLPSRTPAIALSPEQVFRRYKGFDGQAWPGTDGPAFSVENGLALIADWPLVGEYVQKLDCAEECDVIVLAHLGEDLSEIQQSGWEPVGFDVGFYDSEHSHFSVILNEVLFGVQPELRAFSDRLNERMLIGAVDDVHSLLVERTRLVNLGRDLETGYNEPITVFQRIQQ